MEAQIDPAVLMAFGPPPPGIDLHAKQEVAIITVALVSTAFATVALVLRLWARNFQRFGMMADDYLMIIALTFTYGTLAITILGARAGAGMHVWALTPPQIAQVFKLLYTYTFVYAGSVSFTKLSILLFYRRLFERGSKFFWMSLSFAAFFTVGYMFAIWGVAAGLCHPTEYFWTQFLGQKGWCLDINSSFLSLTVLNLVADIFVLLVPIPEIFKLQMSTQKKIGVCAVMALGGLVCVVSSVRIWAFYKFTVEVDVVWVQADVFLLSSVEPAFGIVSACLPSLRPLYRRARTKLTGKDSQTSNSTWNSKGSNTKNSYVRFGDERTKTGDSDNVALTSVGANGHHLNKPIPENIIVVRSEITQSSNHATGQPHHGNDFDSY
ncbi:hypothetical protein GGS21DRAFT_211479 [Xylaria nigripes]|nr:hypothetical protein GGS21DRAFT_211479 [Xylaria nigripes]